MINILLLRNDCVLWPILITLFCDVTVFVLDTQQNSYSISHYAALRLHGDCMDSDGVVTVVNCWQHGDWGANGSVHVVTVLPAVNNSDYCVTVQSPGSHSAPQWLVTDGIE